MKAIRGAYRGQSLSWAGLVVIACGSHPQRGESHAVDAEHAEHAELAPSDVRSLKRARAARDAARALTPPAPPKTLDRQHSLEYVNGPLREWVLARRALSDVAAQAYLEANLSGTKYEATGLLEVGELWQTFGDTATSAVRAAIPEDLSTDEQMRAAYFAVAAEAARPVCAEASRALEQCVAVAERRERYETRRRCAKRLALLPESASATREEGATPASSRHPAPDRPTLPSTQPSPCVFPGSLRPWLQFDLWADPATKQRVARPYRLDISALTVPDAAGAAARVNAVWPLQGTYWIDAAIFGSRSESTPRFGASSLIQLLVPAFVAGGTRSPRSGRSITRTAHRPQRREHAAR